MPSRKGFIDSVNSTGLHHPDSPIYRANIADKILGSFVAHSIREFGESIRDYEGHSSSKPQPGHSPVQEQVGSKQELPWVLHGAPDETDHQDLQPGTFQKVNLVVEGQIHKA